MSSLENIQSKQLSFQIVCPRCREDGVIVWEDFDGEPSLVSLTRDFYERISKKSPYGIELVCTNCDMIQRDISQIPPLPELDENRAA